MAVVVTMIVLSKFPGSGIGLQLQAPVWSIGNTPTITPPVAGTGDRER